MIIVKAIGIILASVLLICAGTAGYVLLLMRKRPPLFLYELRRKEPDFLPLEQIPPLQIQMIITQEDCGFYSHPGYDIQSIRQARKMLFRKKRIVFGGSTITQQLAKNLYFRFDKSFLRKAAELLIALRLEHDLGKNRILELYVNIIYFGNGVYGLRDAARFYFNKDVSELSLNQMVILSIIPPAPTAGNPIQHPEVFERRRNWKLRCFTICKPPLITPEEEADIRSHDAAHLDPELRKPDDFTQSYPQTIPMINERFGRFFGSARHPGRKRPTDICACKARKGSGECALGKNKMK